MRLRALVVILPGLHSACSPASKPARTADEAEPEPADPARETAGDPACRGTPSSGTERELVSRAEEVRGCYDALIRRNPSRQGRVVVGLRIAPDGQVVTVGLVQDDLRDPDFETCALERFSAPFNNPPASGCLAVQVPMRFAPMPGH